MDDDELAKSDAVLLLAIIRDNDHWNPKGIPEQDVSVVFEMSARCNWGSSFSVMRFRKALALLEGSPYVVKRAGRWYTYDNERLETIEDGGARVCAKRGCSKDISHLRADAAYCSAGHARTAR